MVNKRIWLTIQTLLYGITNVDIWLINVNNVVIWLTNVAIWLTNVAIWQRYG